MLLQNARESSSIGQGVGIADIANCFFNQSIIDAKRLFGVVDINPEWRSDVASASQGQIVNQNKSMDAVRAFDSCELAYRKAVDTVQSLFADLHASL